MKRSYRLGSSGRYPIMDLILICSWWMLIPSTSTSPESGLRMQQVIRMAVVLPAPLGPMIPRSSPFFISRLRLSKAFILPKDLLRDSISIIRLSSTSKCLLWFLDKIVSNLYWGYFILSTNKIMIQFYYNYYIESDGGVNCWLKLNSV